MAAFFFYDLREVIDADKLEAYRAGVLATVREHRGRYRVLGGACRVVEGDWSPRFPVVIEFPDFELAQAWYESESYRDLRALRQAAALGDAVLIDAELDPDFSDPD